MFAVPVQLLPELCHRIQAHIPGPLYLQFEFDIQIQVFLEGITGKIRLFAVRFGIYVVEFRYRYRLARNGKQNVVFLRLDRNTKKQSDKSENEPVHRSDVVIWSLQWNMPWPRLFLGPHTCYQLKTVQI